MGKAIHEQTLQTLQQRHDVLDAELKGLQWAIADCCRDYVWENLRSRHVRISSVIAIEYEGEDVIARLDEIQLHNGSYYGGPCAVLMFHKYTRKKVLGKTYERYEIHPDKLSQVDYVRLATAEEIKANVAKGESDE